MNNCTPNSCSSWVIAAEIELPGHIALAGVDVLAVQLAAADDAPVIGVNVGMLGYLTEVEPSGLRMAVKRFLAGSYSIEERMCLDVTVERQGAGPVHRRALNERRRGERRRRAL